MSGENAGPSGQPDFAAVFAHFSAGLKIEHLPPAAIDAVKTNLTDTMACAMAGWSADGVQQVAKLAMDWGGKPQASIWCTGDRIPAHHAAWVNGMMAHARDYDDTHDLAVLHAGVSVVPAAVAAAELSGDATGADLICGIAAGLELVCRLGLATKVNIIESGFMYTSLFGHFAATVAAARVLCLDAAQTANALGVAHSQAAGTHQVSRDGALTKRMQPGFAAQTGIVSALLSKAGINGTINTFEGIDGLYRTHFRNAYDPSVLRSALGDKFEFVGLSYKPYPCCRLAHAGIDAALRLYPRIAGRSEEIDDIEVRVNRQAFEAVCTPAAMRAAPATVVQAQFSLPYTIAWSLVHGTIGLDAFTADGLRDEAVARIAPRVRCVVDEAIDRVSGRGVSPAAVTVSLDGNMFSEEVVTPRGGPDALLTADDLNKKLADCMAFGGLTWPEDAAREVVRTVSALDGARDIRRLLSAITASPAKPA